MASPVPVAFQRLSLKYQFQTQQPEAKKNTKVSKIWCKALKIVTYKNKLQYYSLKKDLMVGISVLTSSLTSNGNREN